MLHIGCHLSSSKGFLAMGKTALSIGADTFQFFTRNPRGERQGKGCNNPKPGGCGGGTECFDAGAQFCAAAFWHRTVYDEPLRSRRKAAGVCADGDGGRFGDAGICAGEYV